MRPYTQDHVLNVTDQVSVGTDKVFNSFKYDAIGSIYVGGVQNVCFRGPFTTDTR